MANPRMSLTAALPAIDPTPAPPPSVEPAPAQERKVISYITVMHVGPGPFLYEARELFVDDETGLPVGPPKALWKLDDLGITLSKVELLQRERAIESRRWAHRKPVSSG